MGLEKGKATLLRCGYIIYGLTGVVVEGVETVWIADLAEDADELQSRLCIAPTEVLPSERWWFYPRVKK